MTFRAYPNADRARRQIDRHIHLQDEAPLRVSPTAAQFMHAMGLAFRPNSARILENLRAAISAMPRAANFADGRREESGVAAPR